MDVTSRNPSSLLYPTLAAACVLALTATLTACGSSSAGDSSPTNAGSPASSPASSASPSPTGSARVIVGVDLAEDWVSQSLADTGTGYGMTLESTSDPDLYDGHIFHRQTDGAVTDQQVITIILTSRDGLEVTWSDGSTTTGALRLDDDGAGAQIDLPPDCSAHLAGGGADSDCVLFPADAVTNAGTPTPIAIPTIDEAMSYLCSVEVSELSPVTDDASDPYATSVLQAALATLGYDPGPIDGKYGRRSRAAVRAFQSASGVTVDGLVGPQTWTSLQTAACNVPDDPASSPQPSD